MQDKQNSKSGAFLSGFSKAINNPLAAQIGIAIGPGAKDVSAQSDFPKAANGQQDAFRHVLGSAQVRRRFQELKPKDGSDQLDQEARDVLSANEYLGDIAGNSAKSKEMDLFNNDKGIEIGRRAAEQGWTAEETEAAVRDYISKSNGTGQDGGAFWHDKNDPERVPPKSPDAAAQPSSSRIEEQPQQKPKPLTAGEELRRQYQEAVERATRPDGSTPDANEIDPVTGKKFGDMRAGEYAAALYRKRVRQQANDNASNDNQSKSSGGSVSVRAYDREGGRESVSAYIRQPPKK